MKNIINRKPKSTSGDSFALSDQGNAQAFVADNADKFRHVEGLGWFMWDGRRWKKDSYADAYTAAVEAVRKRASNSDSFAVQDHALHSEANSKIKAMLMAASMKSEIRVRLDEMDTHPRLLNCLNGTVDLLTGKLKPHDPADLITMLCPHSYDPDATCPIFLQAVDLYFSSNFELITFMQCALGYSLTGCTDEQCLFILYGDGANGKSTLVNIIHHVIGRTYGQEMPAQTILFSRNERIPNDIARLRGARFVSGQETGEGNRLNEPLIKSLTGGDKVTARFLRKEFFEFTPTQKIWLATNHQPSIRGTDEGIWRRLKLIPFDVHITPEMAVPGFDRKLVEEAPGILVWLVRGAVRYFRDGHLPEASIVTRASQRYRTESDVVGRFLDEETLKHPDEKISKGDLYDAYKRWCNEEGEPAIKKGAFGKSMMRRGFADARLGNDRGWSGIRLRREGDIGQM